MSRGASAFTCKGCRQVARLVGEVGDIRQMMECMKWMVTGQGLKERRRNRGSSGTTGKADANEKCERVMTPDNSFTEESRNGKETAERSSSEDRGSVIEIEGQHGTAWEKTGRQLLDGNGIRPGTQMLATHGYKKNPDAKFVFATGSHAVII